MVGVVWHGHYLRYLENARWALMNRLGYGLDRMVASGYAWPIVDLQARYVKPARFGDRLRARASLVEWEHPACGELPASRDVADGARVAAGPHRSGRRRWHDSGELQFALPGGFRRVRARPRWRRVARELDAVAGARRS